MNSKNLLIVLFALIISVGVTAGGGGPTCRVVTPACNSGGSCSPGEYCNQGTGQCCGCTTFTCSDSCTYAVCAGYTSSDGYRCCVSGGDCTGGQLCTGNCSGGKYCEAGAVPEFDSFTIIAAIAIVGVALFAIRKRKMI